MLTPQWDSPPDVCIEKISSKVMLHMQKNIVVYGYNAASHSLGVVMHSGSGGLCRGRRLQGPHEVGSQVPRVPAIACRASLKVQGCILSVGMAIQLSIQSFFLAMAGHGPS